MKLSRIAIVLAALAVTVPAVPAFAQTVTQQQQRNEQARKLAEAAGGLAAQTQNGIETLKKVSIGQRGVNAWANNKVNWQTMVPTGTWWRNANYVQTLALTAEQQKKMDDVFQQARIKLIDLTASVDKEEAILEPLLQAERLDVNKTAAQIDKVADARAALEKGNARMLLGIREVLTPEQWTKLNSTKLFPFLNLDLGFSINRQPFKSKE